MQLRVASLYRYPVKGLSAERLTEAQLVKGGNFPGDRLYAIENGPSGFDPLAPQHQPKIKFLMLMRNERLARLATRREEATHTLTIRQDGNTVVQVDLRTAPGRAGAPPFYINNKLRANPKTA